MLFYVAFSHIWHATLIIDVSNLGAKLPLLEIFLTLLLKHTAVHERLSVL
jgi:hypothetical protein